MKYEVWFKLMDESQEENIDFTEDKYKKIIENAVVNFNLAGEAARNWKYIYYCEIEKNVIKIQFESAVELEVPTKSFRYFSKDLIDNSEDFRRLVSSGRLLKGVYTGIAEERNNAIILSDEQMLATLLHWCMSKEIQSAEEKKNKKAAIEKIKNIIVECEMMNQ